MRPVSVCLSSFYSQWENPSAEGESQQQQTQPDLSETLERDMNDNEMSFSADGTLW